MKRFLLLFMCFFTVIGTTLAQVDPKTTECTNFNYQDQLGKLSPKDGSLEYTLYVGTSSQQMCQIKVLPPETKWFTFWTIIDESPNKELNDVVIFRKGGKTFMKTYDKNFTCSSAQSIFNMRIKQIKEQEGIK